MPFSSLEVAEAVAALSRIGIELPPTQIEIEPREERWLVRLPKERIAWFARSDTGRENLIADRKVLRLVESRCRFHAPRVLSEDKDGEFDVRAMVPGASDPFALYNAACNNPETATRIGTCIGHMLGELHTRIQGPDVENFVQHKPDWPESRAWILERLPNVMDDRELIAKADDALSRYEQVEVAEQDCVLIHGDLGMHALAYDPHTFHINGIFDFEGSAYADRHHDFRYLILGDNATILDAALAAYQPLVGRTIDRDRVYLYNAACAITYLAFRIGHEPEEPWCGRTLTEDLAWTTSAIAALRL